MARDKAIIIGQFKLVSRRLVKFIKEYLSRFQPFCNLDKLNSQFDVRKDPTEAVYSIFYCSRYSILVTQKDTHTNPLKVGNLPALTLHPMVEKDISRKYYHIQISIRRFLYVPIDCESVYRQLAHQLTKLPEHFISSHVWLRKLEVNSNGETR